MNTTYAQQIQFTSQFFYDDNPHIANPQTSFDDSDAIYGIATFKDAIINMPLVDNPSPYATIGYFVTINGEQVVSDEKGTFVSVSVPGAMFSKNYTKVYNNDPMPLCLIPSDEDRYKTNREKQGPYRAFMNALAKHGKGIHTIKVDIRFMDQDKVSEPIASGAFTLNITKSLNYSPAGKFPAAKKVDNALINSMKTALINGGWTYNVKKINIIDADWTIHRNAFGQITKRTIDTYVGFEQGGGKCKAFNISFKQDYDGSKYGITQTNGTGQSYELPCSDIK